MINFRFSTFRLNKIRHFYRLCLFSLFMLSGINLFAQNENLVFERLNTSHGLSNNEVREVFQDSKGYLWVCTADGLNKYDGYNFTVYRHNPQDTNSISNNSVWDILEDKSGNLWIGTDDGLNYLNLDKEVFRTFNYSDVQGAWTNSSITLYEDDEENIWFGTVTQGISKFNPKTEKFIHFLPDSANLEGANSNAAVWILKDSIKKDRFWLGMWQSGFYSYDIITNEFVKYKYDPKQPGNLTNDEIRALFQDKNGIVWIGTKGGGLNRFDPNTEKFTHFKNDSKNSLSNNYVEAIYEDPQEEGNLWIGTQDGLNKFDTKLSSFSVNKSDVNNHGTLSSDFVQVIYKDRSGVMWVGTETGGLNKIDPGRVPFRHQISAAENPDGLNSNDVFGIVKSAVKKDVLWIGTYGGGLNKFDRDKNIFTYFKHNPSNSVGISSDNIRSLYEDPDEAGDVLWVGTGNGGLNRFDIKKNRFKSYKNNPSDLSTISSNLIRQIYETRDGAFWIATNRGLNKFDRKKETFTRFIPQDTTYVSTIQNLLKEFTLKKKPLVKILQVKDFENRTQEFEIAKKTKFLVVALGEGVGEMIDYGWLEAMDGKKIWKMEFEKSLHAGGAEKNRIQVWAGTLDAGAYNLRYVSDDSHSYGTWNEPEPLNPKMWGIQVFEINDNENRLIAQNINKTEKANSIIGNNLSAIVEDSYGMLWVATQDRGLSKLDRKTGHFTNFTFDPGKPNGISSNVVLSLHVDKSGTLWVGTRDGLNKYDSNNNSFKFYTIKDGLPNNAIINISEDAYGNLWLATNKGISRFDPNGQSEEGHLTFINYGIPDGLQFNNYNLGSYFSAPNGEMFFGGAAGFVSFFPGKINQQPPRTLISDFQIFNEPVIPGDGSLLEKHISQTESIELSHNQNVLSFEFTALHFSRPEKNLYRYKMEGLDKNWIDGKRRFAPYTNLDPGEYRFRVKASNSDGVWDEKGTALNITILPPWWRTIWAYFGYGLLFVTLIFGIDRLQRRRLLAKSKERLKMQAAEHRAEAAELQARAVQAENERKSQELEEARQLQLSMLPHSLPQLPHLDIAVYMKTATEVGGDYYDFHVSLDGTLTVVIGDATGHGMKAGTMVTTAKSLFNSYAPNPDILFSFQEITRCIKNMNLGKMSMCMTMLKIQDNKMIMSSAGMPPSFIFRKETRVVEEHLMQGMPLGTMDKFPYKIQDCILSPGDTILLLSDGLPELQNEQDEMYGYKRVRNVFEEIAEKEPEEIINYLKDEGSVWVNEQDPDDDVTFVVIKVK